MRHTLWIELYFQKAATVIGQLLRRSDSASAGLRADGGVPIWDALIVALPLAAFYGMGMGLGAGFRTAMYNGAKLSLILFASGAICLPSFYVFSTLAGSRFSFKEAARSIAGFALIVSVIWAALAPVTGFFTASVSSGGFLIALHVIAIFLGFSIGGSILGRALAGTKQYRRIPASNLQYEILELPEISSQPLPTANAKARVSPVFFIIWFGVYAAVVSQLFVDFTPYLEAHSFLRGERIFFLDAARQVLNWGSAG
ncbi:MAG: hypothetical protein AB1757_01480 [Acidobacteriota bacterium]